jgi:hypothetical protein
MAWRANLPAGPNHALHSVLLDAGAAEVALGQAVCGGPVARVTRHDPIAIREIDIWEINMGDRTSMRYRYEHRYGL